MTIRGSPLACPFNSEAGRVCGNARYHQSLTSIFDLSIRFFDFPQLLWNSIHEKWLPFSSFLKGFFHRQTMVFNSLPQCCSVFELFAEEFPFETPFQRRKEFPSRGSFQHNAAVNFLKVVNRHLSVTDQVEAKRV